MHNVKCDLQPFWTLINVYGPIIKSADSQTTELNPYLGPDWCMYLEW